MGVCASSDDYPTMDNSFTQISPTDERIVWIGRHVKEVAKKKVIFDWSGTKMVFSVTGSPSQVWLKLDGQSNVFNVHYDGQYGNGASLLQGMPVC